MDIKNALIGLSSNRTNRYGGSPSIRVVSQGTAQPMKGRYKRNVGNASNHYKRPHAEEPQNTIEYLSDPVPYDKKEERNMSDVVDNYTSNLSDEQRVVLETVLKGYNVFFTGDAGTGKSYILRVVVEALQELVGKEKVYVTASTGIAACNIGGITLHSFSGIGMNDTCAAQSLKRIKQNESAVSRWKSCEVLVVDEVSMLDGRLMDRLEYIARQIRHDNHCFGGMQIVLCGDFFQLPPVGLGKDGVIYCFESERWNQIIEKTIVMKQVFRQKDTTLQQLLREIRYGQLSQASVRLLATMSRNDISRIEPIHDDEDNEEESVVIKSTKLFAYNRNVDDYNNQQLEALPSAPVEYRSEDTGDGDQYLYQLTRNCQAPSLLCLKRGAQVMLVKNLSVADGLVNGCRGVVVSFKQSPLSQQKVPVVLFTTPKGPLRYSVDHQEFHIEAGRRVVASRTQIPLKLAWGISIHKSQGMTIDLLDVDLSGVFECGMTYVALSRGVSVERMAVHGFREKGVMTNPKVIDFYNAIKEGRKYSKESPEQSHVSPRPFATPPRPFATPPRPFVTPPRPFATPPRPSPPLRFMGPSALPMNQTRNSNPTHVVQQLSPVKGNGLELFSSHSNNPSNRPHKKTSLADLAAGLIAFRKG